MAKRKSLDLMVLLIVSALAITASASIYYGMLAQSTATVVAAPVSFTSGNDSAGILTLGTNNTYASLSLDAYPNVTLYYEQAVNITATADKQIRLRHVLVNPDDNDPSVGNFTSVVFRLIQADGSEVANLTYTTTGNVWNEPANTGYSAITNGDEWTIQIEILAVATATSGVSTTIEIAVDVQ